MYCGNCGKKINDNVAYCPYCGSKVKDPLPSKVHNNVPINRGGKLCAIVLVVVLVMFGGFKLLTSIQNAPSDFQSENEERIYSSEGGFATPEDAVEAFMVAFKAQNVDGMLATFDTECFLDCADFSDYVKQLGTFNGNTLMAPTEYGIYKDLLRQQLRGDRVLSIQMMAYSVLYPDLDYAFLKLQSVQANREWAEKLCNNVDPQTLQNLELIEYRDPIDKKHRDQVVEDGKKQYGCEELAERVAVFQVADTLYYKGFLLLNYSGRWYVHALRSSFASEGDMGATRVESQYDWTVLNGFRLCGYAADRRVAIQEYSTNNKKENISFGFETADAAAEAFIEAFRNHDIEGMMATLNIDPYLNHMDYVNYVDKMGLAYAGSTVGPVEYDFYSELVRYRLISGYSEDIEMLMYNILCSQVEDDFFFRETISVDRNWTEKFREAANPDGLNSMENLHWLSGLPFGEKWIAVHSQLYGCDNYAERNINIDRAGVYYGVGLELAEYDGRWYVHRITGSFTREENSNTYWAVKERREIDLEQEALSNLRKKFS